MGKNVLMMMACAVLAAGCASNMTPSEAGSPEAARKVLIAGETSAFKSKVVAQVIENLGTRDWYFRMIGLDRLAEQETSRYGAILLVASQRAGRMDNRVSSYLSNNPSDPKVIIFLTRGSEPAGERVKPVMGVDAVSSASRDDGVERRAKELAALIEKRFSTP